LAPAKPLKEGFDMRNGTFNSPFLLGFEHLEKLLERSAKAQGDGYPPYNIEQTGDERIRITLAVAGFEEDQLTVTIEDNQLIIRGKQAESPDKTFLHKGIATRQFQRAFVLADGIEVAGAELRNGLLSIDLARPKFEPAVRTVEIKSHRSGPTRATVRSE
jgi:HSP20 family molecular chaperone IbpA